jgi:hypothetical protein
MKIHTKQAIVCSVVGFVLACGALYTFQSAPASADGAGEAMGRLFALTGLAGTLCGWVAAKGPRPWSWPKFVGVYALTCVLMLVLTAHSHAAAQPSTATAVTPTFTVKWPAQWAVQHLDGVSSDPRDRGLGTRERVLFGDAKAPRAAIEVGCMQLVEGRPIKLAKEFERIVRGISKSYEDKGYLVAISKHYFTLVGTYDGLAATLVASNEDVELIQTLSIAQSATCLLTSSLSARNKAEYEANLDAYLDVKLSVR